MDFKLLFKENNDNLTIHLKGELDIYTSPTFKKEVLEKYNDVKKDIVFNGKDLEYIDSTGLGSIIYIFKEVKEDGNKIFFENIKQNIRKLFTITKLDQLMTFKEE